jgi:hypothetical protein
MRFPVRCLCLVASLLATSLAASAREPDALAEIPLGIEAVTGYRSEYIHRGFKFAGALVDFQAEAEIALSTHLLLNVGGWFATGVGGADFEEAAGFLGFRQETDELTLGVELTLRRLRHSEFESGFDLALISGLPAALRSTPVLRGFLHSWRACGASRSEILPLSRRAAASAPSPIITAAVASTTCMAAFLIPTPSAATSHSARLSKFQFP